jgi:Flp pilus assembly protein TadG
LVLLVIGVADYGRVFFTSITVANAARAGAEYGAQNPATSIDTVGMKIMSQQDGNEIGTITLQARTYCECGGASHGCTTVCTGGAAPDVFVEVTATKVVSMLFSYPGLPDSVTISRKAIFRSQ